MDRFRTYLSQKCVSVAQSLTPVLWDSKFRETGMLTPIEFVRAGDKLVELCPTWSWSRGDKSRVKDHLPPSKQFLKTEHVHCHGRLREIYGHVCEEAADAQGWVKAFKCREQEVEEAEDMESFMNGGMIEEDDDSAAMVDNTVKGRTYTIYITYDTYYRTPRVWLHGYSEKRRPLTKEEMYEDISEEHARKSVTMEYHPHMEGNVTVASVHPCKHAEVMKLLMNMSREGGKEFDVEMYLHIFLKFVQTVVPTIECDFTQNFDLKNCR